MLLLIKDKTYEDRLGYLTLKTLETGVLRGDRFEAFKILKGFDNLDPSVFFYLIMTSTRGHSLNVVKPRCRLDIRKFVFAYPIVVIWNSLCDSINNLKNIMINLCMVKGLNKLFIKLPSHYTY